MYQRFKDCLLKPRNIADYIKEPKKKTVIYTTILLIVYIIPLILISLLSNTSVTKLSSSISNDLIEAEQINYEIKDGKLVSINNDNTPQVIKTKITLSDAYLVNTLYVFDITGENYLDSLNVDKGAYLVLLFKEDAFNITTIEVTDTLKSENNTPGIAVDKKVNNKDNTTANIGDTLTYTLTINNKEDGPLDLQLPFGDDVTIEYDNQDGRITVPKGEITITLKATVPSSHNVATDFVLSGDIGIYNPDDEIGKSGDTVKATNNIEKTITVLNNQMKEEQEKIYLNYLVQAKQEVAETINAKGFERSHMQVLAALTRLRQICCHPSLFIKDYKQGSSKLEQCIEIIKDATDAGHKILLFSGYTSMFELIENELQENGITYFKLTGSTKVDERIRMVDEFNVNKDIKVFLISLKAGGTGLNLTGADMVIHYDPWWNASAENQATDRAYRIGQKNNVQVYKLITKNSIEEKIYELQQKKSQLIDNMLDTKTSFISKLSKEDIMKLFE